MIRGALQPLPPPEKLKELREVDGVEWRDIAARYGRSVRSVMKQAQRAKSPPASQEQAVRR